MKIIIQIKNVYGRETIYPMCEKSKIFASMVSQKTLTRSNLLHIVQLGYEIEVKTETPAWAKQFNDNRR